MRLTGDRNEPAAPSTKAKAPKPAAAPKAPPKPPPVRRSLGLRRWRRAAFLGSIGIAVAAVLTGGGYGIYRAHPDARVLANAETELLRLSGDAGLMVSDVEVEGRDRTSREALLQAIGAGRGTPILALDPVRIRARIEAMPWVREASVERLLPGTLYIKLVERSPLALWQRQGRLMLIDRDGSVVPVDDINAFPGLLVLVGDDAPPLGAALVDMLATEPALAGHVAAAVRVGGRRWNLRLDSGIDVELPEENAAGAWRQLAELERSDALLERDVQAVDLRLPDRTVVRVAPEIIPKPPTKKSRQGGKST